MEKILLLCEAFEWLNKHLPYKGGYTNYMNELKMRGFALDAPSSINK